MPKLFLTALSLGDALNATESAAALARAVRSADRELTSEDIVAIPLVDGCSGTLEFLVNHSLGSYVEVEATDAAGDQAIVPFGLCGSDEKLAVIEMQSIAGVDMPGARGTTFGVGELIRDVLDEGAFSVILAQAEPIARDAGLGLAASLGVKFFDDNGIELDMAKPDVDLGRIERIDASGRAFEALAARFFVARSNPVSPLDAVDKDFSAQLRRLATIVKRDIGIELPIDSMSLSKSGIEFGLIAFLSAAIRDGAELVIEAAQVLDSIAVDGDQAIIVLARDEAQCEFAPALGRILKQAEASALPMVFIFANPVGDDIRRKWSSKYSRSSVFSLQDAKVFQAPLGANASADTVRRDLLVKLDKLMSSVLSELKDSRQVA